MEQANDEDDSLRIGDICRYYGIGALLAEAEQVSGGYLHQMWLIHTTSGRYALKRLNPEIMARPEARPNYLRSERVARAAAAAGIPAVLAIALQNSPLADIAGSTYMLFEWIEGSMLSPSERDDRHARTIGELLERLHRLQLPDMPSLSWKVYPQSHWEALLERGSRCHMPWSQSFEARRQSLLEWNKLFEDASMQLRHKAAVSHCDLNPRNVLWSSGGRPSIIDWESAGPTHPTLELIDAALSWSERDEGQIDRLAFMAVIEAYAKAGGEAHAPIEAAIYGRMGGMLDWLEYNMRRSMDTVIFGEDEQKLGAEQADFTFASLQTLSANVPVWAEWAAQAFRNGILSRSEWIR
ncbi:phosphotransferase [Paenibacillus harenae]|uniref:Aminoglycoside phosphotransferase (APT) family kinase protein n=1 Tax=Paenibacillus harenae TaxID=306543 RepID=A0ABT9U0X5_PAEHA|nr:phosphotransferase [Paenibacillus harenae]MDQ0112751.1 aminoglycoside phosphotransferase (APT) family kinase protein [Paenibacillus harenae]